MDLQLESEPAHSYARPAVPTSTFGKNLRAMMKQRELKPQDLLPALGVKQGTLSDWMRDRRGLPEGPTLLKFAKALRVTVNDLLAGVDDDHDLLCHMLDARSGPSSGGLQDVPASDTARRLESVRERDQALASEVRDVIGRLGELAVTLEEETGSSRRSATGRARGHRTAG
jgi:transcriptional regulator with XRE-family HTH domain